MRIRAVGAALAVAVCALVAVPPTVQAAVGPKCPNGSATASPAPAGTTPVILTHGWTGSTAGMKPIGDAITKSFGSRTRIYYFDYSRDSYAWASKPGIASCLAHFVHNVTDANHVKAVFVGHSLGGLAIRFASSPTFTDAPVGRDQLAQVITIDTPHLGSPWGGTPVAELAALLSELMSRNRFPRSGTDAARCLMAHSPARPLPSACPTPPYLAAGVPIMTVEGENTVERTLFGIKLYDIDQFGDGIVLGTSSSGYPHSAGEPTPTGYAYNPVTVSCRQSTDLTVGLLRSAIPPVPSKIIATEIRAFAFLKLDEAIMTDISAGKLTIFSGAQWFATELTAACSHTAILSNPSTAKAVSGTIRHVLEGLSVSRADLQGAPVPSLRGMPAGNLKHGDLNPDYGFVTLVTADGGSPALGDITGDGNGDASAVVRYSSGAGGGDESVLLYTKLNGHLRLLGEWNTAQADPQGVHGSVTGMVIQDNLVVVHVVSERSGASPGREYSVSLRWTGSNVQVASVQDISSAIESVGNAFLQAAVRKDAKKMRELSTPSAVASFAGMSREGVWSSPGRCTLTQQDPAACEVTIVSGKTEPSNWALIFRLEFGTNAQGQSVVAKATFSGDTG